MSSPQSNGGTSVLAKDITYSVRDGKNWKTILNNVSMIAKPGQVLAIMGPSGSGKTTLLNALADRVRVDSKHTLSGDVRFNGEKCSRKMVTRFSNYVMQSDQLLEYLTVDETVYISAQLKLKKDSTKGQRLKADKVLHELGLEECRDVRIGGESVKGISGGQKKRVSVAIELLDEPSVLFLDEPTSGLDSSLAYEVLKILLELATRGGRTVICTVHQPRSQLFALFDQLLLLTGGEVAYHGPAAAAVDYFSGIGYSCPSRFNPADFFLDLLSFKNEFKPSDGGGMPNKLKSNSALELVQPGSVALSRAASAVSEASVEKLEKGTLGDDDQQTEALIRAESSMIEGRILISEAEVRQLPIKYASSKFYAEVQADIDSVLGGGNFISNAASREGSLTVKTAGGGVNDLTAPVGHTRPCDWCSTFAILCRRVVLNTIRNPMESYAQLMVNTIFGLLIGGLFFQLTVGGTGEVIYANAANIAGCLFFTVTQYSFSQLDALIAFPKQRALFNRETANGLYTPSAYYTAFNVARFPFQHVPPVIFTIIVYWMAGLAGSARQFFLHLITAILTVFASIGYCFMIGSAFPRLEIVNIVAPAGLVIFMILSGFLLQDQSIPMWIGWLKYASFMRYSFISLAIIEFTPGEQFGSITNDEVLSFLGVSLALPLWANIVLLLVCGFAMRLLGYIFLAYTNRKVGIES